MALFFRRPTFGNTFRIETGLIVRNNLNGQPQIFRSSAWPVIESFKITLIALSIEERDAFLDFYRSVAGEVIVFTDHETRQWEGVITTENPQLVSEGRGCKYKTEFEFEGRILPAPP
jgi:hypothetical protein